MVYSDWAFEVTLHSFSAILDGIYIVLCANSPDRDLGHLIATASIMKRLSLYEFTLWGQDLVSVVHIRESLYSRGFFLNKIYENFVGTLETVRNIEVSILERCPYREV